nr:hypothetical protein [Ligaoa zhengdingensis]
MIEGTKIGRQFIQEQRFRALFSTALGLSVNLLYAFYHGALGVVNQSLWFVAMCAYYIILSSMRFSAVLCGWKRKSVVPEDTEYFVAKLCGGLLALLSFILAVVVSISLSQNVAVKHGEIVMITIATYTFYKITIAIIRAIKQRKNTAPLLTVIRTIGYAEVAASLLTLQRSMLVSFGPMDDTSMDIMNGLTGISVCLFILLLGIFTISRSSKERKKADGTV